MNDDGSQQGASVLFKLSKPATKSHVVLTLPLEFFNPVYNSVQDYAARPVWLATTQPLKSNFREKDGVLVSVLVTRRRSPGTRVKFARTLGRLQAGTVVIVWERFVAPKAGQARPL